MMRHDVSMYRKVLIILLLTDTVRIKQHNGTLGVPVDEMKIMHIMPMVRNMDTGKW